METYIALLRGINVNGKNRIQMQLLTQMLIDLDYYQVRTYIQSGNVVFQADNTDTKSIAGKISNGISQKFGYDVEVIVLTKPEFDQICSSNPYAVAPYDTERVYITIFQTQSEVELPEGLNADDFLPDMFSVKGRAAYIYCPGGYGNTRLSNTFFERKTGLAATTRNLKTMRTLVSML